MDNKEEKLNRNDYTRRLFKYIIIGVLVGMIAKWVSTHNLLYQDIIIIGLSASTIYMILDIYTPSIYIQ